MFRRLVAIILILLFLPAFALGQDKQPAFVMAGFDGQESPHNWETNLFFVRMENRTGISFTFQQYKDAAKWQQAKDAMFAGQTPLPDVLFKANLTTEELLRGTDSGVLIDLLPLLEENAPNFYALLQQRPEWLQAITLPNGKIGALPSIQFSSGQNILWINQDWLTALNLPMPTDFASLRQVLTAFRDEDPNQNGKADEIPLSFLGPWDLKFFSHGYGVVANDYNLYLDDAGQLHYWADEDSFFQLAGELHSLYADGLLDEKGFAASDLMRVVTSEDADMVYGMFFAPSPLNLLPYSHAASYVAVPPFVCGGEQIYRDVYGNLGRGAFAITSACEDPAAMLRWVDQLYCQEGAIEAMAGIENENYTVNADGMWTWKSSMTETITSTELQELTIYDSGNMPWLFPEEFYNRYSDEGVRHITGQVAAYGQYLRMPLPYYSLTIAESQALRPLQNQLGRYVDETFAQFILGEIPLNEETIAAFRQGLRDRGMEDVISIFQPAIDRATMP